MGRRRSASASRGRAVPASRRSGDARVGTPRCVRSSRARHVGACKNVKPRRTRSQLRKALYVLARRAASRPGDFTFLQPPAARAAATARTSNRILRSCRLRPPRLRRVQERKIELDVLEGPATSRPHGSASALARGRHASPSLAHPRPLPAAHPGRAETLRHSRRPRDGASAREQAASVSRGTLALSLLVVGWTAVRVPPPSPADKELS
jgi:hypothetical protein